MPQDVAFAQARYADVHQQLEHLDIGIARKHHEQQRFDAAGFVVGSIVNAPPPGCVPVNCGGCNYQQCGSTWYQPQGAQYVVIALP